MFCRLPPRGKNVLIYKFGIDLQEELHALSISKIEAQVMNCKGLNREGQQSGNLLKARDKRTKKAVLVLWSKPRWTDNEVNGNQ